MGAVYLAYLEPLDKPVAVKEMYLSDAEPAAIAQFTKEATMLAHLEHPALVPVTDFFEENGRYYFVMAYVKGKTLGDVITEKGRLGLRESVEWTLQLCSVLEFLHAQDPPILFRDLKPSNVMIDEENKVRLIDFGIARVLEQGEKTATFLQGVGSAGYSPLEQYGSDMTTDQRSDLYSLGATLYAMLTGRSPTSPVSRISERKQVDSPRKFNPEVPINLEAVLVQMLAVRKEERQTSVAVARDEIETAVARRLNLPSAAPVGPFPGGADLESPTSRVLEHPTTNFVCEHTTDALTGLQGPPPSVNLAPPTAPRTTRPMPHSNSLQQDESVKVSFTVIQSVFCAILVFLTVPYFSDAHERFGFFEYLAWPSHTAGHLVGKLFGGTMEMLGGPLGQIVLPLAVLGTVLVKHRSVFASAAASVWVSQTVVSWGAHMHQARMGRPAFFNEHNHDWQFLLGKMKLLHECEKYGDLAIKVGQIGMMLGLGTMVLWLAWGYLKVPNEEPAPAQA